jgi:hypothetical protein
MYYDYEEVTPERAGNWLDGMKLNVRPIKKTKLAEMVRDIKGGRWRRNGATLKQAPNGELIDGQHRALAVVEADVPVWHDIAYNVPFDAMPTIDTGSARTFGDVLKLGGESDVLRLGAITKRVLMWKQGYKYKANVPGVTPSHSELGMFFEVHRGELRLATARGDDIHRLGLCNPTSAATAFYLFAEIEYDQANLFMDMLIDGENLTRGNPIWAIRQRLMREAARQGRRLMNPDAVRVGPSEQLALIIHGWNLWRRDEEVDKVHIVYSASGKGSNLPLTNANFPDPK